MLTKLVLLLSLLATPLQALTCQEMRYTAELVMDLRQAGYSETKIVSVATRRAPSLIKYYQNIANAAHQYPPYSSELLRKAASKDFGHRVYIACKEKE